MGAPNAQRVAGIGVGKDVQGFMPFILPSRSRMDASLFDWGNPMTCPWSIQRRVDREARFISFSAAGAARCAWTHGRQSAPHGH